MTDLGIVGSEVRWWLMCRFLVAASAADAVSANNAASAAALAAADNLGAATAAASNDFGSVSMASTAGQKLFHIANGECTVHHKCHALILSSPGLGRSV